MSNERTELAEVASDQIGYECRHWGTPDDSAPGGCSECWELGLKVTDAILAAGYRKCSGVHLVEAPVEGFDWPPNCSSDDYECCASGSCEVCRR